MTIHLASVFLLLIGGMLAGAVDTIIGGGGLFSLPTLFLIGLPPQAALGTNQFALSFGSLVGTWKFNQMGFIKWWPQTVLCLIGVLPGAVLGSITAIGIPQAILQTIVICLLTAVGIAVLIKRNFGSEEIETHFSLSKWRGAGIFLTGLAIGFYEGFFGPGSGLLATFSFVLWFGLNFIQASGSAKAVGLLGNIAAFVTYAAYGQVHWITGLMLAVSVSAGSYIGAIIARRSGSKVIRPIMLIVIMLLIVNALRPLFSHL